MNSELKPCPFCGGKAAYHPSKHKVVSFESDGKFFDQYRVELYVSCTRCRIKTETYAHNIALDKEGVPYIEHNGYNRVAEIWNRRTNNENA